ncbi:MAG: prepilin-type N-terminal cleavage/methylation domain-containing protein [Patescibacteria group bacterium]
MKKGFTITELLIVIFIIGLLAAIVVVNLSNSQAKSRYAKVLADMETIGKAANLFQTEAGRFPHHSWPASDNPNKYLQVWPIPTPSCSKMAANYNYEGMYWGPGALYPEGTQTSHNGEGVSWRNTDGNLRYWYPITGSFGQDNAPRSNDWIPNGSELNILLLTGKSVDCP